MLVPVNCYRLQCWQSNNYEWKMSVRFRKAAGIRRQSGSRHRLSLLLPLCPEPDPNARAKTARHLHCLRRALLLRVITTCHTGVQQQWRKLAPALMSRQLLFSSKKANFLHLIEFFCSLSPESCHLFQMVNNSRKVVVEIIVYIHRLTLIRINSLIWICILAVECSVRQ